jgi:uncharacterized protein YjbI with pentapeptide repeats/CRP-like cAMP-binding protein
MSELIPKPTIQASHETHKKDSSEDRDRLVTLIETDPLLSSPMETNFSKNISSQPDTKTFSVEEQHMLELILKAETTDLFELAALAGLNPLTDYAGGDLRRVNLSGKPLQRADLHNANLSMANLSGADLSGANLSGADLSGADLSGANLSEADLSKADLSHANFCGANLNKANLCESDLSSVQLIRAFLSHANLSNVCLQNAQLIRSNLSNSILRDANLQGATLQGTNLSNTDLGNANLSYANLSEANLTGSNLKRANLNQVDFSDALLVESARFGDNDGLSEENKQSLRSRKAILTHDIREVLLGWEELSESDREWLIQMGKHRELPDGAILIQENVSIPALYIILQGKFRVVSSAEKLEIATLSGGEVVGEMSFVRPLPPSAMVEAIQNSCIWEISRQQLTEKLENDLEFGCRFYKALTVVLSSRLKLTTLMLLDQDKKAQSKLGSDTSKYFPSSPDSISLASLLLNGDDIDLNRGNYDRVTS